MKIELAKLETKTHIEDLMPGETFLFETALFILSDKSDGATVEAVRLYDGMLTCFGSRTPVKFIRTKVVEDN